MSAAILGPVLADILTLAGRRKFTLASAFYSAARLDAATISSASADLMVRLDLNSIDSWVARAIAPDALLRFWERHANTKLNIYYGPGAHVKAYAGDGGFLVGSANFTVRGLSGTTDEMLWLEGERRAKAAMARALNKYRASLTKLSIAELESYVRRNIDKVKDLQSRIPPSEENTLPRTVKRPPRLGTYDQFLTWLAEQISPAAKEVLARANGKGQLSGHIRMNFYGIRQFLLANPLFGERLRRTDADDYLLHRDVAMQQAIKRFVDGEAVNEGGLNVTTWRTYLPMSSGGAPKSGGGTSGNLNRMLPLLARFIPKASAPRPRV